jgi:CubicO group peptidase (beta-lactamase class C family)
MKPIPASHRWLLAFLYLFFPSLVLSRDLEGTWQGILDVGLVKFRVALEVKVDSRKKPRVLFDNIDDGRYDLPLQVLSIKSGALKARLNSGQTLSLRLNPKSHQLVGVYLQASGNFEKAGISSPLTLTKGRDYLVPRLDETGREITRYQYHPPEEKNDWETGTIPSQGVSLLEAGIQKILEGTFPHIHGIVMVRKGRLLLDECFYGYASSDLHPVQSITKSVFSLLFGMAQDKGLLQTGQKLYDYFPSYRSQKSCNPRKNQITLDHLLTMSSGLDCDDWKDPQACSWGMVQSEDWLDFVLSKPLAQTPGSHFAYCGSCLLPLSVILEKTSGMSVSEFAQKNLFDPLGIHSVQWVEAPSAGTTVVPVSFGLSMSPRDLAKIGQLVLNRGTWQGQPIVSEDWMKQSTSCRVLREQTNKKYDYGYLWWETEVGLKGQKVKTILGWGVGGNYLFIVPDKDLVCVISAGNYNDSKAAQGSWMLFQDYVLPAFSLPD